MKKIVLFIAVLSFFINNVYAQGYFSSIKKNDLIACNPVEVKVGYYCGGSCSGVNRIVEKKDGKCVFESLFYNFECSEKNDYYPTSYLIQCFLSEDNINEIVDYNNKNKFIDTVIILSKFFDDESVCKSTKEKLSKDKCFNNVVESGNLSSTEVESVAPTLF
ncbi:MAG: hypothetical protein R3Y43_06785 [Alphaproteobacteria bacterium]